LKGFLMYRHKRGDEEYVGTAHMLSEIVGLSASTIGAIARGERTGKGISVKIIPDPTQFNSMMLSAKKQKEWDDEVAKFRKVKWVPKGGTGKKLYLPIKSK